MTSAASCHVSYPASDPFTAYTTRLRKDDLLSAEDERKLAQAIARGDAEARDRMTRANLRLVITIARQYLGRGLDLDDLVGAGNLGLIRAVGDYDPGFAARFSTYAVYWIKQAIRDALTNTGPTIRLPAHMVQRLREWYRAKRALEGELGKAPSFDRVADRLGLAKRQRNLVRQALRSREVRGQGDGEDPDPIEVACSGEAPEVEAERSEMAHDLWSRIASRLDEREREVITLRFGLGGGVPMTLKEVGRRLGVTREWTRKIEKRAVAKLRDIDDDAT